MIVAASTECFAELPLAEAFERLNDLEYTNIEIALHEDGNHIKPSRLTDNFEKSVAACHQSHRMTPVAYSIDIRAEGDEYYRQFHTCCRLAKATKVVSLTVPSGELGTPFNEEVERLRKLVGIATLEGVLVSVKTETGCVTEDPDTVTVLCNNVEGLGITLDPSHYVYGPLKGGSYDKIMKYVYNVHLRDTTKDTLQVRVGQGEIEYGRIVTQLAKQNYRQALTVNMRPIEGVEHASELRKMRLLLESLLF